MFTLTAFVVNMILCWVLVLVFAPVTRHDAPFALLLALPLGSLTTLFGWLTGKAVNTLVVFPKQKTRNFIKGVTGAGIVCLFLSGWVVRSMAAEKMDRNVEKNENSLLQPVNGQDDTRTDLSIRSFRALEKTFGDPDSLHLIYHFAVGPTDSAYSFYYVYELYGHDNDYRYARVDAYSDTSIVRVRSGSANTDTGFLALYPQARAKQRARLDTAIQEIQGLPDSVMSPEVKKRVEQLRDGQ